MGSVTGSPIVEAVASRPTRWSVPSERELDASLPDVASVITATVDRRRVRATSVVVVLPTDPRARVAAQRMVEELRRLLGSGAVQVTEQPVLRREAGAAVLDLRQLAGTNPLGRFGMPTAASQDWAIDSSVDDAGSGAAYVRMRSSGLWGAHRAVAELLEFVGLRFLSYNHTARPASGSIELPAPGERLGGSSGERFAYRGMAPHTYHPIELSMALHDPSPRSARVLRRYVDWCVATGQNVISFPLLDVEAGNAVVKLGASPERRRAWEAHVRGLLAYAHERGVQVAANASFTVFTAAHLQALGIIGATIDTFRLNRRQAKWLAAAPGTTAATDAKRSYDELLERVTRAHEPRIRAFVERIESLGFDELQMNLGTSEFTSPNDDLQIAWMELAQQAAERSGSAMRVTVSSHVPADPTSPRYGIPMFDLHLQADAKVGAHIHTVEVPALTDRAETYGVDSFAHKLDTLDQATADRLETWYPETSYWVQYDVTVPLFLPVYMLTRHRDHRRLLDNDRLDGQLTFTTAWEWGYWLNDAAVARMSTKPDASLTQVLLELLEPLGDLRDETVTLLADVMRTQQRYLVDQALLRHLQGFDALSSLGERVSNVPILNKVIHAASNVPQRTGWRHVRRMDREELDRFAASDLVQLRELRTLQQRELDRARALRARATDDTAVELLDEFVDGIEINLLRTTQVLAALEAMVFARRSRLGDAGLRDAAEAAMQVVRAARADAERVIRRREAAYRESPQDAYAGDRLASGAQGTMWPNRSLTSVHTLKYWDATIDEAASAVRSVRR